MIYEELSRQILAACFEVSNELGAGYLESVYEKALLVALTQKGINVATRFKEPMSMDDALRELIGE